MEDLLDPEALAAHRQGRQRAMTVAALAGFAIASLTFWSIAYLTEAQLELPALGSVALATAIHLDHAL